MDGKGTLRFIVLFHIYSSTVVSKKGTLHIFQLVVCLI